MIKKSFRIKIIIPTVVVLVALVVTLNIFLSVRFSALSDALINEKLVANSNSLKLYLEESRANSKVAAVSMAANPDAVKAIRERDRNEILRLFAPTRDLYRISYFTLCDNEGKVLVRTYEPASFGDSVANQQNIKDALNGKVSTYLESGTLIKVSVRTGAPVYDTDGTLVGVISAGIRFDSDSQVEELKKHFNAEVTVFFGNTKIATTITKDGNSIVGTTIDPHIAEIVIENKQEYSGDVDIFGEKYKTFYMPLLNSRNEAFASFFLGIPKAEIIAATNKSIRDGILLGLGGLAVSIVLLFFIMTSISKPIIILSNDMNHIANGNLRI
ncbi:MAG: cache domain-containing protein, partial [Spirochaetaceae bacterium]|nr:cache domain-containing protein [Spirochaetaceae bacterium]